MKAHVLNGSARATSGARVFNPFARIAAWVKVARERQALASLPEHMLRDIGIDRGVAAGEADRPFWDVPQGRRDLL